MAAGRWTTRGVMLVAALAVVIAWSGLGPGGAVLAPSMPATRRARRSR